ncbi:MAG: DUF547 domain-containing protein [Deltaproteobacteria bacterium]|nr:MAG: DUF547 domain-containing protein [Deltaproteobacteria bacterium]
MKTSSLALRPIAIALLALTVGLLVAVLLWGRNAAEAAVEEGSQGSGAERCELFDHEHRAWSRLLGRYVHSGVVDYASWKRSGEADLDAYLRSLQRVCSGAYETWSREEKLAFWINAYNAYTVRLVLDHYPLGSIREIGLLPGAAFRMHFIPMQRLRGRTLSLDDIEHGILRKEFAEPRIHFAIVCASKSCPVLRAEAYRAEALEAELDDAARTFLGDPNKNRYDAQTHTLWLSRIFDWFHEDFERSAGSVLAFVRKFMHPGGGQLPNADGLRIEYLDYDWALNGR